MRRLAPALALLLTHCSSPPATSVDGGGGGPGARTTLRVSDPSARACELVLEDLGGAQAVRAYFDGVLGAQRREAPHLAISFTSETDAPLPARAVEVELQGAGTPTVRAVRCFDPRGRALPEATIQVGG